MTHEQRLLDLLSDPAILESEDACLTFCSLISKVDLNLPDDLGEKQALLTRLDDLVDEEDGLIDMLGANAFEYNTVVGGIRVLLSKLANSDLSRLYDHDHYESLIQDAQLNYPPEDDEPETPSLK